MIRGAVSPVCVCLIAYSTLLVPVKLISHPSKSPDCLVYTIHLNKTNQREQTNMFLFMYYNDSPIMLKPDPANLYS